MYRSGVLTETKDISLGAITAAKKAEMKADEKKDKVTNYNWANTYKLQWLKIDHAVLIIGYGYDTKLKMKYWVIRNSYGPGWGDKGNFLIRRGMNDFGVESDNLIADVILLDQ